MLAKLVRKNLLTRDDADTIERDINRGGIAVFVREDNADEEQRAINIMRRNGTHNVHAHTITLRKDENGGAIFDHGSGGIVLLRAA